MADDSAFMYAALALARRGLGITAPNPSVAALVVDERVSPPRMLGRGLTAKGGRPHAEALALAQAGEAARGATLFVTLEPCAERSKRDYGPSCTERILESGIARVVIGAPDPSPFAAGQGAARLKAAGLEVIEGVLQEEAARLNLGHCLRMRLGRPFMRLKIAQTADGFAATADHKPLAITGEETRAVVHRMRADVDALITGIGTILADDPRLDVRLPGMADCSPLKVVLDTGGRIPPEAQIIRDAARVPVLIATAAPDHVIAKLGARAGVEVIAIPKAGERLDLAALLGALSARGITRVMVEAGPRLCESFATAGFCDELVLLTGPNLIQHGLVALGPGLLAWRSDAQLAETRQIGPDMMQIYTQVTK